MEHHQTELNSINKKPNSTTKWLIICFSVVILAFIAVTVFRVSLNNLFFVGLLLACPLMHFWMMKDGGHKH